MSDCSESVVRFDCQGATLQGVAALPGADLPVLPIGVVIVVGGPQYRAGSHRQFVLLARQLAEAGHAVLRFDCRGMGDSAGSEPGFENIECDIGCAVDAFMALCPAITGVVLWGLCDGASAALLYCHRTADARVKGLSLLNPWVRSENSLARTQVKHYYAQRLMQKEFWLKLLSGKVAARAINELFDSLKLMRTSRATETADGGVTPARFQTRMAQAWMRFKGPILLILSGNDLTAKEFLEQVGSNPDWTSALNCSRLTRHDIAEADHTFSNHRDRSRVETLTREWLQQCDPAY